MNQMDSTDTKGDKTESKSAGAAGYGFMNVVEL